MHATSSRIFYYQNQPVVQKARKVFGFSHVKAKQDQECGGKVCRNTKGVMASNSSSATAQRNSAQSQVAVAIALTVCE